MPVVEPPAYQPSRIICWRISSDVLDALGPFGDEAEDVGVHHAVALGAFDREAPGVGRAGHAVFVDHHHDAQVARVAGGVEGGGPGGMAEGLAVGALPSGLVVAGLVEQRGAVGGGVAHGEERGTLVQGEQIAVLAGLEGDVVVEPDAGPVGAAGHFVFPGGRELLDEAAKGLALLGQSPLVESLGAPGVEDRLHVLADGGRVEPAETPPDLFGRAFQRDHGRRFGTLGGGRRAARPTRAPVAAPAAVARNRRRVCMANVSWVDDLSSLNDTSDGGWHNGVLCRRNW